MKYGYLILFFILVSHSYAQKGRIHLIGGDNPFNDSIPVEIKLYYENGDLIYKNKIDNYSTDNFFIDSLAPGRYNVNVDVEGKTALTYYNVKVVADKSVTIQLFLSDLSYKQTSLMIEKEGAITKGSTNTAASLFIQTYQPGLSDKKESVNSIYAIGIRGTPMYYASKFYGIGAHIGTTLGYCNLQKDKMLAFKDTFNFEHYFFWKFAVALNNRFVFVKAKEGIDLRPCFLDLSIGYNLPIVFRYAGIKRESKVVQRNITNFNDFSAMARLAFGVLCFSAEYRLTNNIKPAFVSVPNLMLGIEIIIPN